MIRKRALANARRQKQRMERMKKAEAQKRKQIEALKKQHATLKAKAAEKQKDEK